jgi:hypothetical protein
MLPLAHVGHWAENFLFVLPILVIGLVVWHSRRQEQADGIDWEQDEGWDDPRLREDPRLVDDDAR